MRLPPCYLMLFLCWLPLGSASAQSMEGGARAAALGGAATALEEDVWGHANPASWATLSGRAVSFFASEAFGLSALRLGALIYVQPTRLGTFAGSARTFGFDDFRDTRFSLGYARRFRLGTSRAFHLGVTLRYYQVSITNYGSAGAVGVSVGWLVSVLPSLQAGFHAVNLNAPRLNGQDELPRALALGLSFRAVEQMRVLLDVFKDVRFPTTVRGGLEVRPLDVLALRAGATAQPTRFTAGAGLRLGWIAADVAAERHHVLGWSPAVSFEVRW